MVRQRVVILGGGFGGLSVARRLIASAFGRRTLDVTVVDVATVHTYTPWIYEVASGALLPDAVREERKRLDATADFSFASLRGFDGVRFRCARVVGVDDSTRHVMLHDGMTVPYDVLVVAVGAEPNFFGIPGLERSCLVLKNATDAVRIQRKVASTLLERKTAKGRPTRIVVCGAGPNGTELAAELAASIQAAERRGRLPHGMAMVTLVDGADTVLRMFPPSLVRKATTRLRDLGVELRLNTAVAGVDAEGLLVKPAPKKGAPVGDVVETLPVDICVWSGGVKVSRLAADLPFAKNERGRILVGPTLQVEGRPHVFALGDCAVLGKTPDPQTADAAMTHAAVVARNVLRVVQHRSPRAYRAPRHWAALVAVGGKFAVAHVGPLRLSGYAGYVLRRLVDLHYFTQVMPWRAALKFWWTGVAAYAKNEEGV